MGFCPQQKIDQLSLTMSIKYRKFYLLRCQLQFNWFHHSLWLRHQRSRNFTRGFMLDGVCNGSKLLPYMFSPLIKVVSNPSITSNFFLICNSSSHIPYVFCSCLSRLALNCIIPSFNAIKLFSLSTPFEILASDRSEKK